MIAWAAGLLLLAQAAGPGAPVPLRPAKARPARPSLALAVVPLSFEDQAPAADLAKDLVAPLGDYYRRSSQGAFEVAGRVWAPVAVPAARGAVRKADLAAAARAFVAREGTAVLETADALVLAAAGPLGARGSALWPHKDVVDVAGRAVDYVLVPADAGLKGVAVAAHELMHVLGVEDKYDDEKADVGADCILGTGFDPRRPPPPCAECRVRLGWTAAVELDPSKPGDYAMERGTVARIPLAPGEALLLELRDALLVWHTGGGKRIELVARLPEGGNDRLTPFSEPPFRGRSPGAGPAWITGVRLSKDAAAFRVGPDAPLTPSEEERRHRVGKRIGD